MRAPLTRATRDRPRFKTRTRVLAAIALLVLIVAIAFLVERFRGRDTPKGFPPGWHCTNFGGPGTTTCEKDQFSLPFANLFGKKK